MYKIDLDEGMNIIYMEASGYMQLNEIKQINKVLVETLAKFDENEALILISMERFDPVSQDNLNIIVEDVVAMSDKIKKIGFIHKRTVTRMQQVRIFQEVNAIIGRELPVQSFQSKKEALNYLLE